MYFLTVLLVAGTQIHCLLSVRSVLIQGELFPEKKKKQQERNINNFKGISFKSRNSNNNIVYSLKLFKVIPIQPLEENTSSKVNILQVEHDRCT